MTAGRLALAIGMTAILGGCVTKSSPVAPSDAPTAASQPQTLGSLSLTVVVKTRGAEMPIPGAAVFKDNLEIGTTDASGTIDAVVEPGVAFHITVSAAGYDGNGAWGTVESAERWTFYLAAQP